MKKIFACLMVLTLVFSCVSSFAEGENENTPAKIDMTKWHYEAADDVYWQVGLSYAATPVDSNYENMGIFVPGAYFTGMDNGDGTYTCTVNESGTAGQ